MTCNINVRLLSLFGHDKKVELNVCEMGESPKQMATSAGFDLDETIEKPIQYSDANDNESVRVLLVETFYISSKKNNVFQVRLTERGLTLSKETNNTVKEPTIHVQDIIGCRSLRSKRRRRKGTSCTCPASPGPAQLKVVEDNSLDLDENDVSAYLYIYAYILKKNRRGVPRRRERTTLTLRFRSFDRYEDNDREAQKWRTAIKHLTAHNDQPADGSIDSNDPDASKMVVDITLPYVPKDLRKVLVLLNPKSGSGKSRESFQKYVAPVFIEAEIPYELQVTRYANYAREFVRHKDIYVWRSILVVGGDGILYEVINGLFERTDWEKALNEVPIGVIPSGSGNGLAKAIAHSYNEPYEPKPVLGATLAAVRGYSTPMDLVRVETKNEIMFSFLSIGWGLIADVDIESERLRSLGHQRFTIWSIHRIISLRTYRGTLSYLPATHLTGDRQSQSTYQPGSGLKHSMSYNTALDCPDCNGEGDCEMCDHTFADVLSLETNSINPSTYRSRADTWYSANSRKSAYFSATESVYQSVNDKISGYESDVEQLNYSVQMYGPASTLPALTTPVPETWTSETGEFVMVHAVYESHISSECMFAPSAKLNDGIIWMLVIRAGVSRQELFKFLLALSSGTHIPTTAHEYIQMIPVTAFRIEPSGNQGHYSVDGERVDLGPLQCEVFPGIAKILVPHYPQQQQQQQ